MTKTKTKKDLPETMKMLLLVAPIVHQLLTHLQHKGGDGYIFGWDDHSSPPIGKTPSELLGTSQQAAV